MTIEERHQLRLLELKEEIEVLRTYKDQFLKERNSIRQHLFDFAEAYRSQDWMKIESILTKVDLARGKGGYQWKP